MEHNFIQVSAVQWLQNYRFTIRGGGQVRRIRYYGLGYYAYRAFADRKNIVTINARKG